MIPLNFNKNHYTQQNAIVFGQTSLCIKCMEFLLEQKWKIRSIISDDENIIAWGKKHKINCLKPSQVNNLKNNHCYVFSIINPLIIPKSLFINNYIYDAFNYHDSLLPRYAGINSTTWAIINNERMHGITWHRITPSIDDGDIVIQKQVMIEDLETSYSLNLKCTQIAYSTFLSLIEQIDSNELGNVKQELMHRTYFSREIIPDNYAVLNQSNTSLGIRCLIRALNFGNDYINPVSTVKMNINDKLFIISELSIEEDLFEDKESNFHIKVVNDSTKLSFSCNLLDIYGNKVSLSQDNIYYLDDFRFTESSLEAVRKVRKSELIHFNKLRDLLGDDVITSSLFCKADVGENYRIGRTKPIALEMPINKTELISVIQIVLNHLCTAKNILIIYDELPYENSQLDNILDNISISWVDHTLLNLSFNELVVTNELTNYIITKDFAYRYRLNLLSDIAINFNAKQILNQHRLIIEVTNQQVIFKYYQADELNVITFYDTLRLVLNNYYQGKLHTSDLRTVDIIPNLERQKILYEWNNTLRVYPKGKTLHLLFEEQVEITPNSIAITFENQQLTYRELNQISNQLARKIRYEYQKHIGKEMMPGTLIALCLERNIDIVIAIVATLKSGVAYVPIAPNTPEKRLNYVLTEIGGKFIITHDKYINKLRNLEVTCRNSIRLFNLSEFKASSSIDETNLRFYTSHNNLAYVIYTSGTTGNPKGVMINHSNVVNTIYSLSDIYNLNVPLKLTGFANYVFDAFVLELWVSLCFGNELHILGEQVRTDTNLFSKYINDKGINFIPYIPTKLLNVLPCIDYKTLTGLYCGGEAHDKNTIDKWKSKYKIYNVYGTTETGIFATDYLIQFNDTHKQLIGKPLANFQTYVLNKYYQLLPIGAIGELYIAGDSVGCGYLNSQELTTRKFINNPFYDLNLNNPIMYATGDLVRYNENGILEYIERSDTQVKIRGHRIELFEIQSCLLKYSEIKQALVIIKRIGNSNTSSDKLVAYYTAENDLDEFILKSHLANYLPDYMIPNYFWRIEAIPLKAASGKVDEHKLPILINNTRRNEGFTGSNIEQIICKAFAKVLGIEFEQINVEDDFFELGGDSLSTIALSIELQNNFGISVTDIFELRTPRKIANENRLVKGFLNNHLQMIKDQYHQNIKYQFEEVKKLDDTYYNYLLTYEKYDFTTQQKNINNILLTGATGYLGCHILYDLLNSTQYNIYLLVRATTDQHGLERIISEYAYHFNEDLTKFCNRITVLASSLEHKFLALNHDTYTMLAQKIDSIIHAAAYIKHYGNYSEFHQANVQATINLLELCLLTDVKDFHYISTYGILLGSTIKNQDCYYIFTEDSNTDSLHLNNYYNKSKFLGELETARYRILGVTSNIYRVGNLAINSTNGRIPKSSADNRFIHCIKTMAEFGFMPYEFSKIEISPVNTTALGVVKIFDKIDLSNQVHHVFNPDKFNFSSIVNDESIKIIPMNEFIDKIMNAIATNSALEQKLKKFLLHQGWLDNNYQYTENIFVTCKKTQLIMNKMNVFWNKDIKLVENFLKVM